MAKNIYDFKSGKGDRQRLAREFGKGLKASGATIASMIDYARPYLKDIPEPTYEALGAALAAIQLERVEQWRGIPALDGKPAIDESPYNEFMMWLALGYGDVPYDVIITNQPIVSVEDIFPAVHSAIRGGYCNGLTTYSKDSRLGTYSVWSTFAFTTDDRWVTRMRDGESYSPEVAAHLAGIGATHELGHQLFHFQHPFENSACIMNPVPMFAYRTWAERLSPRDCPMGSSPAMQPGAEKFDY